MRLPPNEKSAIVDASHRFNLYLFQTLEAQKVEFLIAKEQDFDD